MLTYFGNCCNESELLDLQSAGGGWRVCVGA